jgi:hypothetical protein
MDWLALVAAVVGAVVGALATALATWWVSVRMAEDRDRSALLVAVSLVKAGIEANKVRLEQGSDGGNLTVGDWGSNKPILGRLRMNDEGLWAQLVATYERVFGGLSKHDLSPAEAQQLTVDLQGLLSGLRKQEIQLQTEITRRRSFRSLLHSSA